MIRGRGGEDDLLVHKVGEALHLTEADGRPPVGVGAEVYGQEQIGDGSGVQLITENAAAVRYVRAIQRLRERLPENSGDPRSGAVPIGQATFPPDGTVPVIRVGFPCGPYLPQARFSRS